MANFLRLSVRVGDMRRRPFDFFACLVRPNLGRSFHLVSRVLSSNSFKSRNILLLETNLLIVR